MNAGGVPYRAFDLARTTDRLAMSQAVFDEVDAVLHRPTLARFVDPALRAELLDQLLSGLAETKHPEEDRPMRVQPISRRRADLAGNDRAVERRQLVEAHERGNFQPGHGGRGVGSHVGAAALN